MTNQTNTKDVAWRIPDAHLPPLEPSVQAIFEKYSKLPADEVYKHVLHIVSNRDKAWDVYPFPCIGQLRFIDFSLCQTASYEALLARLKSSSPEQRPLVLDVGCCFGQDLRKLVVDGAHGSTLIGNDIRGDFLELGFDLFRDRDSFPGKMLQGDVLDVGTQSPLWPLLGKIDVIHAASFLHLFGWAGQVTALQELLKLLKPEAGSCVLGRQAASWTAHEMAHPTNPSGFTYLHNVESFERLWTEVGQRTQSNWRVSALVKDAPNHSTNKASAQWQNNKLQWIQFEVYRI